jgi:hypothetical protein
MSPLVPVLVTHDRTAHAPPDPKQQEHGDRSRDDQHGHGWPDHSGCGGDRGYQQRPRDGPELIKCFVYAEAASESDCSGGVRQQCGLSGAADRLPEPLPQNEDAGHRQPGAG